MPPFARGTSLFDYWERRPPHWFRDLMLEQFRGEPDPADPPGDIDPNRSLIIGDFGHGSDAPIALDYRDDLDSPSVIRLRWSPYGKENRWVYIARSFAEFAEMLGLWPLPE